MQGLGRTMPFTFGAFCIGALSIIGLPPFAGTWSKWYLALGAAETGMLVVVAVYMVSSLLNIAYLMPIVARGFFRPAPALATASARRRRGPGKRRDPGSAVLLRPATLPDGLRLSRPVLLCRRDHRVAASDR